MWPIKNHYITSPFGMRVDPIAHKQAFHNGIDIVSTTPDKTVYNAFAGDVFAIYDREYDPNNAFNPVDAKDWSGRYVRVKFTGTDGQPYIAAYCHLKSVNPALAIGKTIAEGEVIGIYDSTGYSTGDHLHFGIRDANGTPVDPVGFQ